MPETLYFMPDKSIYTSDADYSLVAETIYEQKMAGAPEQETYQQLSETYKPGQVSLMLHYYNRIPLMREKARLNTMLLAVLWLILFTKILIVPNYLIFLNVPAPWKLLIFGGNLIIPGACLYFAYNNIRFPAIAIFSLVAIQLLMGYRSILELLFVLLRQIDLNTELAISSLFVIASVGALLLSRKLSVLFPAQAVKFMKTIHSIHLQKTADALASRPSPFE
jgi:hypothetical protein